MSYSGDHDLLVHSVGNYIESASTLIGVCGAFQAAAGNQMPNFRQQLQLIIDGMYFFLDAISNTDIGHEAGLPLPQGYYRYMSDDPGDDLQSYVICMGNYTVRANTDGGMMVDLGVFLQLLESSMDRAIQATFRMYKVAAEQGSHIVSMIEGDSALLYAVAYFSLCLKANIHSIIEPGGGVFIPDSYLDPDDELNILDLRDFDLDQKGVAIMPRQFMLIWVPNEDGRLMFGRCNMAFMDGVLYSNVDPRGGEAMYEIARILATKVVA